MHKIYKNLLSYKLIINSNTQQYKYGSKIN